MRHNLLLEQRLMLAYYYCKFYHGNQVDKAGEQYILHPLRIIEKIKDGKWFDDEYQTKLIIIALLHDVVEDTNATIGLIQIEFGDDIANAVDAMTKRESETYHDYIKRLAKNPMAKKVKICDLEDNLDFGRLAKSSHEISEKDYKRLSKYINAYRYLYYNCDEKWLNMIDE